MPVTWSSTVAGFSKYVKCCSQSCLGGWYRPRKEDHEIQRPNRWCSTSRMSRKCTSCTSGDQWAQILVPVFALILTTWSRPVRTSESKGDQGRSTVQVYSVYRDVQGRPLETPKEGAGTVVHACVLGHYQVGAIRSRLEAIATNEFQKLLPAPSCRGHLAGSPYTT